ncbi:Rho termination factor N-terminal domain-containing protein [Candidatus Mycoplasma mahonii]|uniref:Rho termination factor N-terminal domain-containing protein n=1 Tax=Candidatus Mycoplasma mahonii TaxID=3004105 RepID=UPI0026EC69E9|nr:Rho termination factor N-terminal domain-containing protein [Candidatus Mycoplasma mahonii]WKX02657.1 Rho termination factor N-terminal domain-containing protein [Candidatus Mycoplasma mahonii]
MINPQMFAQGGQLPNVPSVKELWKKEKSEYRQWILIFGIGILIIFALMCTSMIMNLLSETSIKSSLEQNFKDNGTYKLDKIPSFVDQTWREQFLMLPSIKVAFIGIGIILFIITTIQSYNEKSFAKLSGWSTMVIGIGTLLAAFNLFQMMWSRNARASMLDINIRGGVFAFINNFLIIGVYFGASIKVSKIKRVFAISERVEQLKNDPQYQAQMNMFRNMQNNQGMNTNNAPFGPTNSGRTDGAASFNGNVAAPMQGAPKETVIEKMSQERKDLLEMKVEDLKEVAKKLSISGLSKMTKKELIDNIMRVTSSD